MFKTGCGGTYSIKCPSTFPNTCISIAFENDGKTNCPPPHCTDESGQCPHPVMHGHPNSQSNKSNIVLSAITSLIFTLVAVSSCFWICWKIKDCLIGEATIVSQNQRTERNSRSRTTDAAVNEGSVTLNLASPAQPDNEQGAFYRPTAPSIEDKYDLPPSYDTLYPDRSNK